MAYFSAVSSLGMRRKSAALPIAEHFVKRIFRQMTDTNDCTHLRTAVKSRKDGTERERISLYYDSKNIRQ